MLFVSTLSFRKIPNQTTWLLAKERNQAKGPPRPLRLLFWAGHGCLHRRS